MMLSRGFLLLMISFLFPMVGGCSRPELPVAPGRIIGDGTVTLDGAPLEWGTILFANQDSTVAPIDANFMVAVSRGKFQVEILPGTYRVEIRQEKTNPNPDAPGPSIQLLPKKYNLDSELTVTIDSENKKLQFDLVSSPAK